MQIEIAKLSLVGHREDNQDRVEIMIGDHTVLAIVVDGMGGHAHGARAAVTAVETFGERFRASRQPLPYPQRFLRAAVEAAHLAVVELGADLAIDAKPRATCAAALVQAGEAWWVHVGDSRVYQLRDDDVRVRTRDHTHVELLLQEGLLREDEIASHPMRSYVEYCLGGEADYPPAPVSGPHPMRAGDALLLCTDGFWTGLAENEFAAALCDSTNVGDLDRTVEALGAAAVRANRPASDNASAAVIKWLGD